MFTPYMTDEELQAVAYRDFLEIRMKVKLSFEQFLSRLRLSSGRPRAIHSLIEEKKVSTKSKNIWHVVFINTGYSPTNRFMAGCIIYIPLYRGDEVDYLFINNTETFVLEKLSAHFLARYKERYLECNGINLRGIHPAIYYMIYNQDKTLTYYLPQNWTEEDMRKKSFMISKQGLSLVCFCRNLITYITFLDQENLSRYKAMVYEEEALWKDLERLRGPKNTLENRQALYMKYCTNPEKTKEVLTRYLRRIGDKDKMTEETIESVMKAWDDIVEQTLSIDKMQKKIETDSKPNNLLDVGIVFKKR